MVVSVAVFASVAGASSRPSVIISWRCKSGFSAVDCLQPESVSCASDPAVIQDDFRLAEIEFQFLKKVPFQIIASYERLISLLILTCARVLVIEKSR